MEYSPVGALIQRKQADKNETQFFYGEAALALEMAYIKQMSDVITEYPGAAIAFTKEARSILKQICTEAIDVRQLKANELAMDRNREIVSYKDKIVDLEDEVLELRKKLKHRTEKTQAGVKVKGEPVDLQRVPDTQRGSLKDA